MEVTRGISLQNNEEAAVPSSSGDESTSAGWPFGLSTCTLDQPITFQHQFMSLHTTFLLPFFSDADASSSSASDTDTRSDTASSFFRDSRRITLGSLIGLPDLESASLRSNQNVCRRRSFLSSCGILELLRPCGRASSATAEDVVPESLVDCDRISAATDPSFDTARTSLALEDALVSPDWNEDHFVSCHSILSGGEWTGRRSSATPVSVLSARSTPLRSHKMQKMNRSSSMKSFFLSLCCRIDPEQENS